MFAHISPRCTDAADSVNDSLFDEFGTHSWLQKKVSSFVHNHSAC